MADNTIAAISLHDLEQMVMNVEDVNKNQKTNPT